MPSVGSELSSGIRWEMSRRTSLGSPEATGFMNSAATCVENYHKERRELGLEQPPPPPAPPPPGTTICAADGLGIAVCRSF
jgi:hypothetical protein